MNTRHVRRLDVFGMSEKEYTAIIRVGACQGFDSSVAAFLALSVDTNVNSSFDLIGRKAGGYGARAMKERSL